MAENYCGRNCSECGHREVLNCPGCKEGPGRLRGECDIAKCCTGKGHQECASCGFSGNCRTLQGKDRKAEYRLKSIRAEEERAAQIAARAPFLGKWLWVLFWLVIPNTIASFMTNENLLGAIPGVLTAGRILNVVCSFVFAFVLFKLAAEEEKYRTAGICALISGGINVLAFFTSTGTGDLAAAWAAVTVIAAAIVSFVGRYNEFGAHADILTGVDNELSDKWTALWKWYIGTFCGLVGGVLVMVISQILGLLVMLASAIGVLVVSILELVYLYRTAQTFRAYSEE